MKIITNSNKKLVSEIRASLKENDNYCPCSISKTEDSRCMCKDFRDKIDRAESGECNCGLYIIVAND